LKLQSLKEEDFVRILTEPKNALIKQYVRAAGNRRGEAEYYRRRRQRHRQICYQRQRIDGKYRRSPLHTILEKVLDELSFEAPDLKKKNVKVDSAYVHKQLAEIVKNQDLSRYIL